MDEGLSIVFVENPEESAWGIIGRGLQSFNIRKAGDNNFQRLCYALNTPEEEIVGGILGELYWGWFYIDLLWVREEFRSLGHGHRLLATAEFEARKRGAKHAYLDTFSFQTPEFYHQHGYEVFAELPDFPTGHQRYFLKKQL
jgi:GNAT superfamily N-acetyltransferase